MTQSDWSAEWTLDVTSTEAEMPVKVVVTYSGTEPIPDVTMPIVFNEEGTAGEDHAVPVTVEPGMRFEVRYFLMEEPTWLQVVEGLSRGDDSQTALALFPNPFRKPAA